MIIFFTYSLLSYAMVADWRRLSIPLWLCLVLCFLIYLNLNMDFQFISFLITSLCCGILWRFFWMGSADGLLISTISSQLPPELYGMFLGYTGALGCIVYFLYKKLYATREFPLIVAISIALIIIKFHGL